MAPRILLADDDETVRLICENAFRLEGLELLHAGSVDQVKAQIEVLVPDVLIMNSRLPGGSGGGLCRELRLDRRCSRLPIILLVPQQDPDDRIRALSQGADDCLVLPIVPAELGLRAKNLLRRSNPALLDQMLRVGDLTIDRERRRVHRQTRELRLGPTEYRLLEFLMQYPGKVFSRAELRSSLWGADASVDERAIDLHVGRLRKVISLGKSDNLIRTVRGAGYALTDC
ncbi:MAG: response regulator transcription factor [Rhizobium rhizophilum]|uniref:response regulator transcription factor n=1 Tax=Rhizobium rhizophilum TaxID=1850373 RepID=UPI00391DA554